MKTIIKQHSRIDIDINEHEELSITEAEKISGEAESYVVIKGMKNIRLFIEEVCDLAGYHPARVHKDVSPEKSAAA